MTLSEHAPGQVLLRCITRQRAGEYAMAGGERGYLLPITPSGTQAVRPEQLRTVQ
jgi:hypothetical protein